MKRFEIHTTPLAGLLHLQRQRMADHRGVFTRLFCAQELMQAGWLKPIVQINHSLTQKRGAVRGLHYQCPPQAEMKLVSCVRGAVFDVAVDVRKNSPTFLHWHAEQLTAEHANALLIPEGFAHGFQALTEDVEVIYCTSAAYAPEVEGGLLPTDERLKINWPLPVVDLSARDASHMALNDIYQGVVL